MLTGRFFAMTLMASGSLALGVASAEAGGDAPCAGQCYEQVATPPVYGAVAEQVMVAPPRTIVRRTPAEFATVPRAVTIRPETTVARHVPAEYSTVAETVMVSPGGKRWVVKPDYYGRMIGCWVETPPQYVTRERTVVVRPASVYYERTPAITKLVPQYVMVQPPSYSREYVPAEYAVRQRTVMVSPGGVSWQPLGRGGLRRQY